MLVKSEGRNRAVLKLLGEIAQARLDFFPIVQGLLERRNNEKCVRRAGQVLRDDDEAAITALALVIAGKYAGSAARGMVRDTDLSTLIAG